MVLPKQASIPAQEPTSVEPPAGKRRSRIIEWEEEDFLPRRTPPGEEPRRPARFEDFDAREEEYDDDENWERKRNIVLVLFGVLYFVLAALMFFVLPKDAFSLAEGHPLGGLNRGIAGLVSAITGEEAALEDGGTRVVEIEPISISAVNARGNTNANLSGAGFVGEQAGWLFFANANDSGQLYRMEAGSDTMSKLSEDRARAINVVGEWVYYLNANEDNTVYRCDINGGRRECVMANACDKLYVESGVIHALTREGVLIMLDESGNVREDMPLRREVSDFQVEDDWIFAYHDTINQLYRYDRYAETGTPVIENICTRCIAEGGRLYSLQDAAGNRLVSALFDGGNAKDLAQRPFAEIVTADSWVYFTETEDRTFQRISTDGSKTAELLDRAVYDMQIHGDWMYFRDAEYGSGVNCRVKLNGSGLEGL